MKIICVDDAGIHMNVLETVLGTLTKTGALACEIVQKCSNGDEAVKAMAAHPTAELVTLDIRMPVMDGLSALVKIRSMNPKVKIVMVSSEDEQTVQRKKGGPVDMPVEQKFALLEKIVDRVKKGVQEPGKINLILDGCEELGLDPIQVAEKFGANGYIKKPYTPEATKDVIERIMKGSGFTKAA